MGWNAQQVETVLANPNGATGGFDNTVVIWRMLDRLVQEKIELNEFLASVAKASQKYGNLTQKQAHYVAKGLAPFVETLVTLSNTPKQAVESPKRGANTLAGEITANDRLKALADLKTPIAALTGETPPMSKRAKTKFTKTEKARYKAKTSASEARFKELLKNFDAQEDLAS